MNNNEAKHFPGRGKSLAAHAGLAERRQNLPSFAAKPRAPAKSVAKYAPQAGVDPNRNQGASTYHIKKDDPKVIVTKAGTRPKHTAMPGIGKVVGTLDSRPANKASNMVVLRPEHAVINNNMKRVPLHGGSKEVGLGGRQLGAGGQAQGPDAKWRCAICKFANPTFVEETNEEGETKMVKLQKCQRCREPKQVLVEQGPATGSVRMKPAAPTLQQQRAARQYQQPEKPRVKGMGDLSGPSLGSKQPTGSKKKMMTMGQLQAQEMTDPNKSMADQRRKIKGDEMEVLKKIAHADNVNKGREKAGMGTHQRIQDREYVKNLREPGKFNALTFAKEYGGNLHQNR